jgi:hypothetical protein
VKRLVEACLVIAPNTDPGDIDMEGPQVLIPEKKWGEFCAVLDEFEKDQIEAGQRKRLDTRLAGRVGTPSADSDLIAPNDKIEREGKDEQR